MKRRKLTIVDQDNSNEPQVRDDTTNAVDYAREEELSVETVRVVKELKQLDEEYQAFSFDEKSLDSLFQKLQREESQLRKALQNYRNDDVGHNTTTNPKNTKNMNANIANHRQRMLEKRQEKKEAFERLEKAILEAVGDTDSLISGDTRS